MPDACEPIGQEEEMKPTQSRPSIVFCHGIRVDGSENQLIRMDLCRKGEQS
jgi:hypothetical protein